MALRAGVPSGLRPSGMFDLCSVSKCEVVYLHSSGAAPPDPPIWLRNLIIDKGDTRRSVTIDDIGSVVTPNNNKNIVG